MLTKSYALFIKTLLTKTNFISSLSGGNLVMSKTVLLFHDLKIIIKVADIQAQNRAML